MCILGDVVNKTMKLSMYGEIVHSEIKNIPQYNKRVSLGAYIVMPNHVHLIVSFKQYPNPRRYKTIPEIATQHGHSQIGG